jgi:hypothetical protein
MNKLLPSLLYSKGTRKNIGEKRQKLPLKKKSRHEVIGVRSALTLTL